MLLPRIIFKADLIIDQLKQQVTQASVYNLLRNRANFSAESIPYLKPYLLSNMKTLRTLKGWLGQEKAPESILK